MATFHSSAHISAEKAALVRRYLDIEPESKDEALIEATICVTAAFPDGIEMDVECCGVGCFSEYDTNRAWGQAVLFDRDGNELSCEAFEASGEFFENTTLCHGGNEYVAHIIVDKEA